MLCIVTKFVPDDFTFQGSYQSAFPPRDYSTATASGSQGLSRLVMQELHYRYYEPLCQEVGTLDRLLTGKPVKKLLFMTDAQRIAQEHQPYWQVAAQVKAFGHRNYLHCMCQAPVNETFGTDNVMQHTICEF